MSFLTRDDLDKLLQKIIDLEASDLHLCPGRPPIMRLHGILQGIDGFPQTISSHDMEIILAAAYRSTTGPAEAQSGKDLDFSYELKRGNEQDHKKRARFRVNGGMSLVGLRMVFRRLPNEIPSLDTINVPVQCTKTINEMRQGLILVTGPTGSGKTTTLASWVDHLIDLNDSLHILTLENPIEFRYDEKEMGNTFVTQRELDTSMKSFEVGMKSALRQDPDVILVGEMRDMETIHLALEAAETGHLVLGTVHTTDVPSTITRIVQVYPALEQQAARVQLIGSIRMIVCQRLLKSRDGKRVAAREYLTFTPALRNELLMAAPAETAKKLYQMTRDFGMSMSDSVKDLYRTQKISKNEFLRQMAILQEDLSISVDHHQDGEQDDWLTTMLATDTEDDDLPVIRNHEVIVPVDEVAVDPIDVIPVESESPVGQIDDELDDQISQIQETSPEVSVIDPDQALVDAPSVSAEEPDEIIPPATRVTEPLADIQEDSLTIPAEIPPTQPDDEPEKDPVPEELPVPDDPIVAEVLDPVPERVIEDAVQDAAPRPLDIIHESNKDGEIVLYERASKNNPLDQFNVALPEASKPAPAKPVTRHKKKKPTMTL